MSSGKIIALARSVCLGLLDALGITSDGVYTEPSGGGLALKGATGLVASGLSVSATTSAVSFEVRRMATSDVDGEIHVFEGGATGGSTAAGLGATSPSTRYYLYWVLNPDTLLTGLEASTQSVRLGGTFTVPSGYTHYREIGEFYVDSSGDIVPFTRVGDYVTFDDYRQYPVYSAQAMTNAFVEFAFPSGLPARMERVKYTSQNNATGRAMQVWANDSNGAGESFTATYTNNTGSSYDSMLQSISFWMTLKDTQQSSIFARHHFSGVASSGSNHYLYISGYKWSV